MPAWITYIIVGLVQLAIAVYLFRHYRANKVSYTWLVLLVVFGLAYDNLAIGSGQIFSEGAFLKGVNWVRFALHVLFTPLMVIAIFGIARRLGIGWGQKRSLHVVFCVIAVGLIVMGIATDLVGLTLEPMRDTGVLRYADPESSPPIPSIITILFAIGVGVSVWRSSKWMWLFIGGVVMFIASALGFSFPILGNFGEVVFALAMAASEIYANNHDEAVQTVGIASTA